MSNITQINSYQDSYNNSFCRAVNYSVVKTSFISLEPIPSKTLFEVLGERVIRPLIDWFLPPPDEIDLEKVGDHLSNETLAEIFKCYSHGNIDQILDTHGKKFLKKIKGRSIIDVVLDSNTQSKETLRKILKYYLPLFDGNEIKEFLHYQGAKFQDDIEAVLEELDYNLPHETLVRLLGYYKFDKLKLNLIDELARKCHHNCKHHHKLLSSEDKKKLKAHARWLKNGSFKEFFERNGLIGLPEDLDNVFSPLVTSPLLAKERKDLGIEKVKGVLLYGPPGTGKTSVARNLANYLGVNDEHVVLGTGTELFDSYWGRTEEKIRRIFAPSQKAFTKLGEASPLYMVILDEIDSIAQKRMENEPHFTSATNQLLSCIDGFQQQTNLIVVGITNRINLLDPAILRTGRLGLHIKMDYPNERQRAGIISYYLNKIGKEYLSEEVQIEELVGLTANYTGADIKGLVEKVKLTAFTRITDSYRNGGRRHSQAVITIDDFKILIENKG